MQVEARQSAKLSDVVRCVPKEQPQRRQWATDKRRGQTTGRRQTADTCNRRKSSEWPMTTKLAVKHTKITSNGQKVNKIKQCARREHDVLRVLGTRAQPHQACPGTGTAPAAVCSCPCKSTGCATCCQHSVSGGGGCWRCCCCGDGSNIIPQPMHFCAHTTKK